VVETREDIRRKENGVMRCLSFPMIYNASKSKHGSKNPQIHMIVLVFLKEKKGVEPELPQGQGKERSACVDQSQCPGNLVVRPERSSVSANEENAR